MLIRSLVATFATLVALPAAAYTIDGKLDDWGIDPTNFKSHSVKGSTIEDYQPKSGDNGYLTPGYGGQAYDAEALYVNYDSNKLYLALITGHNPNTVQNPNNNTYGRGDFLIDFGHDGTFEYALKTSGIGTGSLFKINAASDLTLGLFTGQGTPYADGRNAVSILDGKGTNLSTGANSGKVTLKIDSLGFTGYGNYKNDRHYAYEASIDLSLFDPQYWNMPFDVQWTMLCGNDVISADPPGGLIPEPMSLALFGIALAGVGLTRRRNRISV